MTTMDESKSSEDLERNVIDKYFDLNLFILKVAGIWIEDKNKPLKNRFLSYLYNTFWIVFCLILYQPIETGVLFQTVDLLKLARSLRDQGNHLTCIFKLCVWFKNRKLILYVLKSLQSRKFEYEDYGDFEPNKIYKAHRRESNSWAKIFLFGVNFICLNMCFSILYVFIFKYDSQYIVDDDGDVIYNQKFGGDLSLPFKVRNRTTFLLTFIFQVVALDIYGWMIIGKFVYSSALDLYMRRRTYLKSKRV